MAKMDYGLTRKAAETTVFLPVNVSCIYRTPPPWITVYTFRLASYCGPPNRPKNGSFLGNYFYFPGNISYTCDPGFCVEGSILSTCTATGTWSNQPPRCSRMFYKAITADVSGLILDSAQLLYAQICAIRSLGLFTTVLLTLKTRRRIDVCLATI